MVNIDKFIKLYLIIIPYFVFQSCGGGFYKKSVNENNNKSLNLINELLYTFSKPKYKGDSKKIKNSKHYSDILSFLEKEIPYTISVKLTNNFSSINNNYPRMLSISDIDIESKYKNLGYEKDLYLIKNFVQYIKSNQNNKELINKIFLNPEIISSKNICINLQNVNPDLEKILRITITHDLINFVTFWKGSIIKNMWDNFGEKKYLINDEIKKFTEIEYKEWYLSIVNENNTWLDDKLSSYTNIKSNDLQSFQKILIKKIKKEKKTLKKRLINLPKYIHYHLYKIFYIDFKKIKQQIIKYDNEELLSLLLFWISNPYKYKKFDKLNFISFFIQGIFENQLLKRIYLLQKSSVNQEDFHNEKIFCVY